MNFFIKVWRYIIKQWRKVTDSYDLQFPEPAVKRTDILYGYYSTDDKQPDAVKDHVNLNWETQFQGVEGVVRHMKIMKCPTIIDLASQLFNSWHDGKYHAALREREDAITRLRAFFTLLKENDLLQYVIGLAPHDEPNLYGFDEKTVADSVQYMKDVVSEFPELSGVKYIGIYQATMGWVGIHLFDWVGFDDYKRRSTVLEKGYGQYGQFMKHVRPDQRTIILPGATYGNDITPFVNFAHANPEVVAIVPFLWHRVTGDEFFDGLGEGPADVREQYVRAALALTGKGA